MTTPKRVANGPSWMQPGLGTVSRRPSWLAPAPAKLPSPEPPPPSIRPSVPPRSRMPSVVPPSMSQPTLLIADNDIGPDGPRSTSVAQLFSAEEVAQRDATILELTSELERLRDTAAHLSVSLATERRRVLEASQGELVQLALRIAAKVVGEELEHDAGRIAQWAREAISTLPAKETLVVAISADLAERISDDQWDYATQGTHKVEIDPSLPSGTCELRTGVTSVEVSAAARLAAVGEAIGAL